MAQDVNNSTEHSAVSAARPVDGATPVVAPVLALRGISKSFGNVHALKDVDIQFAPGEVHAIVGENGAGKSTLISIAAGVLQADVGTIELDGEPVASSSPQGMRDAGVSVAYQHPALAPDLTVLENLQLVSPRLCEADGMDEARRLIRLVATEQLEMDVNWRVGELSLAQRHVVEIARAMAANPRVLFLDEPTEPFQQADVRKLFELIGNLKAEGVTIVYVSHRLHEVTELADTISVLRDGALIDTRRADKIDMDEIIALIAGQPLEQMFPAKAGDVGEAVLEVRDLNGPGYDFVSVVASAGEIVGLTGIEGQGQREFIRGIAGVDRRHGGDVIVGSDHVAGAGPRAARRAGIGFVPDDRHAEGLFLDLTIRENISLGDLAQTVKAGMVEKSSEAAIGNAIATGLKIRASSIETPVADLSGGNQQKVLFGRELSAEPKVLLVDEPTKGVDIGARSEIYRRLRELADKGIAVVVCSSDGVELEGLCDRVLVFARGQIVRELTGSDVTDTTITEANMTTTVSRSESEAARRKHLPWRRFLASDHFPVLVLAAVTAAIVLGTNVANPFFLSSFSVSGMLLLLAILTLISLGQLSVMLVGAIDLSVGPLAGLAVVGASFLMPRDASGIMVAGGAVLIVALALGFGFLQGLVVTRLRLPAIVVTLAAFIGLQGVSLYLRPRPAGTISDTLSDLFSHPIGGYLPVALIFVLIVVAIFEWALFRRGIGRRLRAVGSDPAASFKLGVNQNRTVLIAFMVSGALTGIAGLLLAGQIGIGSASTGVDYSLLSITVVVLGGASISGGRGSFLCTLLGAAMVQATISASSFLNADSAWYYTAVGALTLIAAILFSVARRGHTAHG